MIIEPIGPHPDIPDVDRQVKVVRVDRIDYVERTASILIEVEHLKEGRLHTYLRSFPAFMTSNNGKHVDAQGQLIPADAPGAVGEFDWLYGAIESGIPLHTLIRSMIQRNASRGNFNTNDFRD